MSELVSVSRRKGGYEEECGIAYRGLGQLHHIWGDFSCRIPHATGTASAQRKSGWVSECVSE